MSIDYEIGIDLRSYRARADAAMPIGMARAGEHVRGVAVARTPNATSHLAGQAGVTTYGSGVGSTALVKYDGPYAAFQNRGMRADGTHVIRFRPAGGMTGFLTVTMGDQADAARDIIADTIGQLA